MGSKSPSKRASVPMWDSSDPDRSPAPLPLNPSSPKVCTSRHTDVSSPQGASLSSRKINITPPHSPTLRSQHVPHQRRMTMGPPSVSEMKALFQPNGGLNQQANKTRSPSPQKDVFGSPPPLLPPLRPMRSIESSHSHGFNSPDLESLSNQLVGLTNIATNLQKEMQALSRRSKDNATDLISLKEATIARDEDIRSSLRDLVQGMGMLEMGSPTPPPLLLRAPSPSVSSSGGSTTFDGDFGGGEGGGGSGGGRGGRNGGSSSAGSSKHFGDRTQFSQNAGVLINKLNQTPGGTPRPMQNEFGKMGMEMQMLERILRDMSTKDGENRIMDFLFELKKNVSTRQGEKEIVGLIEAVRDEVLGMAEDIAKRAASSIVPLDAAAKIEASKGLSNAEDILRLLERIVKEVMSGNGVSDETKDTVLRLNEEVQRGKLATEELKTEIMALKVELIGGKTVSEESQSITLDLKQDIRQSKGAVDETKVLVQEVKVGVDDGRHVMEEIKTYVTSLKERIDFNKMAVDQANDGVADLKGDIRGSRGLIEEVKNIVSGLKEGLGKENGSILKQVLEEVEKINAGQTQLQLRSAADTGSQSQQEPSFSAAALAAINAATSRTMGAIEALQSRHEEFCDESGESSADMKVQLTTLMNFINDITQNTAVNTHESREVKKLFEVIRMGVQSMNDRLASFESEVYVRLDDGVGATSVTKHFEGEETIKERRKMWNDIREDIEEVRRELNDISTHLEMKTKHDEEMMLSRNHVDESILEILKHQKRGGDILMAQGKMHASISDKVEEVRALVEEHVLRGILAAQKAGTDMLVTHKANGEELRGQVLNLRALIEEQVIGQIVSTGAGGELTNDLASIKQHIQGLVTQVMDKNEAQALGAQINGGIAEVKQIIQGMVGQLMGAHNEGFKSDIQDIRKLLDDFVGQVLEKQKGFGMGVLEVIKEVKKIVTDQSNSKTQDELLMKVDEIKRLTSSSENKDSLLNAVGALRDTVENTTATREVQDELLGTVSDIRRIVEDKAMEGNYLGALADLKEYIEEKDFLRQRQDNSINGVLVNAVADVKRTMIDKEVGEDLLAAVTEIKAMVEEKQLVRAQQIAREDELKHQVGLIQRILEEGVIRAIVHLQRDLGDGIRGDLAEVKEQGNDVRSDVSEMRRIVEDDVKTKILDMKIVLEDEIRSDVGTLKRLVGEEIKVDVNDIKRTMGKNNLVDIESHKKTQTSVREVLEVVGDMQTDLKGQQSKHNTNFQELKFLIQQNTVSKSSQSEIQPPQLIQYDDTQIQEKMDKVLSQNTTSSKALSNLDKLPDIHVKVTETASQISEFITVQNTMLQDSTTKQVEAAGQAILALEKARADRAIVEVATTHLKELEVNLAQTTKTLKDEVDSLLARKLALAAELASMEATLAERRSELDKMSEEADAIQRRVVEGALEQARQLVEIKNQRKSGAQSLKRVGSTRSKASVNQQTASGQASGSPTKRHQSMGQLPSIPPGNGSIDASKDYYSVTGGFANRKEDLKVPSADENSKPTGAEGNGPGSVKRGGTRSSESLASSGVMVEDWDDKLHGEEMGLAGPDDWTAQTSRGTRKGSKTYPKSLGVSGLAGGARAKGSGTAVDKRDMSGMSFGSIDE